MHAAAMRQHIKRESRPVEVAQGRTSHSREAPLRVYSPSDRVAHGEPGRITMALAVEMTSARNQKAVEAAIGALAAKFGNRLVTSQAVREQHGNT